MRRPADACPPTRLHVSPLILSEYAHAMGNSSGNLDAWAAAFEAHPVAQGGFIWDWIENPLVEMAPVTDRFALPPGFSGASGNHVYSTQSAA